MYVIIGGGPAGRFAAMELAALNKETLLIEKKYMGGTCLNEGCMVVCGLNDIARFIDNAKNLKNHGIIDFECEIKYKHLLKKLKKTIKTIRKINEKETKESGVEIIYGEAKVIEDKVQVDGEKISYDKLIVATGIKPHIPPIDGVENAITYRDVLEIDELPEVINIVGGGHTASEFAYIFSRFGCKVNVICRSKFLKNLDPEIKKYVVEKLLDDVKIYENTKTLKIGEEYIETSKGKIEGKTFLATGVTPNSKIVNVKKDSKGHIIVNEKMETSMKNVYAAGAVTNRAKNTPVARMEGIVAARNAAGIETRMRYDYIPNSISLKYDVAFIDENKNKKLVNAKMPGPAGPGSFWEVLNKNTGLSKVSVDLNTGEISRVYAVSPIGRDYVAYLSHLLRLGSKVQDFDNFIEVHPSTDSVYKLLRFLAKRI